MKILILANVISGGEWIATQTLVEKLHEIDKNFECHLITPFNGNHFIKKSLYKRVMYAEVKPFKNPFGRYRELIHQISEGVRLIGQAYYNNEFDGVIATDYLLAVSYVLSQKKFNYIYYFHGIKNYCRIFIDTLNHYAIIKKCLEICAWLMSRKIIIPSNNAIEMLARHSFNLTKMKPLKTIPNLIRIEFARNAKARKKKYSILYCGRIDIFKGVDNLIRAFTSIHKKNPKLSLRIVYMDANKYKANKNPAIKFIKDPPTKRLVSIYKSSSLAILPTLCEVSSLFLKESLLCGLPIISTNKGDAQAILSKDYIIDDNNVATLSSRIIDYFKNESWYKRRYRKIAGIFKSRYNEGAIINNWIKIIKHNE